MTLKEIKATIAAGRKVYWATTDYEVIKDSIGQYLIKYTPNGSCTGLTWRDGKTLNGKESEFFGGKAKRSATKLTDLPGWPK